MHSVQSGADYVRFSCHERFLVRHASKQVSLHVVRQVRYIEEEGEEEAEDAEARSAICVSNLHGHARCLFEKDSYFEEASPCKAERPLKVTILRNGADRQRKHMKAVWASINVAGASHSMRRRYSTTLTRTRVLMTRRSRV